MKSTGPPAVRSAVAIPADLDVGLALAVDRLRVPATGAPVRSSRDARDEPAIPVPTAQPCDTATSGRVNAPDWIPARSTVTNRKPAARTPSTSRAPHLGRHDPDQVVLEQLDPGDVAVVPHAAVGEPERPDGGLGGLDLGQLPGSTSEKCGMRDARQGAAGLSAFGQTELPGQVAHVRLG